MSRGGKRKGAGRPAGSKGKGLPRDKMVNIRLTDQEFDKLIGQADKLGVTITELIRSKLF